MDATAQDLNACAGIDVSKDRLDVHIHPAGEAFSVSRDAAGLEELIKRLKPFALRVVAMEATGGFESPVVASLAAAGLPVIVVNPLQVRKFAEALGKHAKTDTIDALVIARFVDATKPEIRPLPSAETLAFADLMARRRQIIQMITAERQRAMRITNASLHKSIARTLLAELPELGTLDRRQIAARVGLAPHTRQSGKWKGKSFISGGRTACRTVLFMGALAAAKHNPDLKAFRQRLIDAGKPKMVAAIAVARKLLTILNAIIRDKSPWMQKTA